ncbi:glycosyltransferase family 39 protein [candidate division KSB1 bacterium]|nr:glycosyltransferase family 39 protein [candidate division KSB1 bacterium]
MSVGVALAIRLILIALRWINPDEGAHLMDARLFLDGYLPIIDFGSRQPFYVAILALFLQTLGSSLFVGRLVPVLSSLGTGVLIYAITRQLSNRVFSMLAAMIFFFLPLLLIWSPVVKTEPLAMLLGTASMLQLLNAFELPLQRRGWILLSGILAALAFYVRQPTLYLPLTVVIYLLAVRREPMKIRLLNTIYYFLGYLSVVMSVCAAFLARMSWQQVAISQLNPLNLILNRLLHVLGWLPAVHRVVEGEGFRILAQDPQITMQAWQQSIFSGFFIVVAVALAISRSLRNSAAAPKHKEAMLLFTIWMMLVLLLYGFQTAQRGFYTHYYTESLPPMILIAVHALDPEQIHRPYRWLFVLSAWLFFFSIYGVQRLFWQIEPGIALYWLFSCAAATVFFALFFNRTSKKTELKTWYLSALGSCVALLLLLFAGMASVLALFLSAWVYFVIFKQSLKKNIAPDSPVWSHRAGTASILVAFFFSAAYSGSFLGPQFQGVWSRKTLDAVTTILKAEGEPADQVLSGGMIWTFQSGFSPYRNVAHPTEFLKKYHTDFNNDFRSNPPRFVVLDGYTQKKYQKHLDFLLEELELRYERLAVIRQAHRAVEIYRLRQPAFYFPVSVAFAPLCLDSIGSLH